MASEYKPYVLSHLRRQKIKLWLPPYHFSGCHSNIKALRQLASSLSTKIQHENSPVINRSDTNKFDEEEIFNILLELQAPAVEKFIQKHSVDLKVVGVDHTDVEIPAEVSSRWGESASAESSDGKTKIRIVNISSNLTMKLLTTDLSNIFGGTVRMIYRGKNLTGSDSLRSIIGKDVNGKKEVLCLLSPGAAIEQKNEKHLDSVSAKSSESEADEARNTTISRSDQSIITSIRQAAETLQNSTSTHFDITDQTGQLVAMSQSDSTSFLTALGLHRLGRSKIEREYNAAGKSSDSANQTDVASALVFLLEADQEWNSSSELSSWMNKVDNYGLLQLDIAWCYLLIGSLDNLPDAIVKLDKAETVLKKQVHANFITLALAQADMGNAIPPLCSVFVRLFLLQGVAYKAIGNQEKANQRLGWARLLCQRLRASSSTDTINELCKVYKMTNRSIIIAALRRSNGDADRAGDLIASGREEDQITAKKRRIQRRVGKCSNGYDWVNVDHISTLAGMLGMSVENSDLGSPRQLQSMSTTIVTGLLRLTNNSVEESFQMYNRLGAETILKQVGQLNRYSERERRPREDVSDTLRKHEVQEMDLVTLMSMGVEESEARRALKATGTVDSALLWLSTVDEKNNESRESQETNTKRQNSSERDDEGSENCDSDDDANKAIEILKAELGDVLGNSKNLEAEWFGVDLDDEWTLIEKYASDDA